MTLRRSYLFLTLPPLFVFILDYILRYSYLKVLELPSLQHFFYSFIFEWTICSVAFILISLFRSGTKIVIGIVVAFLSAVQILVYGHYFYFGVLPNPYSINYIITHSSDSLALIIASVQWSHGFLFLMLFSIQYVLFGFSVRGIENISRNHRRLLLGSFVILVVVFNNNVRFAPSSYSVTPATLFSVKYALQERWSGKTFEVRHGYMRRRFEISTHPEVKAVYNCILFLSESVRKKNYSSYGYHRATTPFLDSMISAGSIIQFQHHVSNAVSTQYSVPMILSGDFTIEKADHPFIYDYLKRWTDVRTYLFTSQSMQRSNIDLVYNTSLDTLIYQEKLPHLQFNDLGIDDGELSGVIGTFLATQTNKKFFSIIQFNNTHFPYTVKPSVNHFVSNPDSAVIDQYDNTIREQDALLRSYFQTLLQAGLLDSTVIIFTSDHGEAFGERGHLGHLNTLYSEEIDVPLWIYVPPGFSAEKTALLKKNAIENSSHLDLFPTFMELYGLTHDHPWNSPFRGASLFQNIPQHRIIPVVGKDMIDTKGVIIDSVKYLETSKEGTVWYEAYNIHDDTNEKINVWNRLSEDQRSHIKKQFVTVEQTALRFNSITK